MALEPLFSSVDLARHCGVHPAAWQRMTDGPAAVLTAGTTRYREVDVNAWLAGLPAVDAASRDDFALAGFQP